MKFYLCLEIQVTVKSRDASVQAMRRFRAPVASTPKRRRLEDSFEISEVDSEFDSSYIAQQCSMESNEPAM